jgi:peptidoglycan/xylan/chitin deacetylase (PgdA/CDA1 family)
MRADRALSLYVFRPLTGLLPRRETKVPILMYHRVPQLDRCSTHPYYCTATAVAIFEQQVRFLREHGYRAVSVSEAFRAVQQPAPDEGQKLVAITFDDGYRDFYTNAFPILSRYGYSGTVFLPTAYIGDSSRRFKQEECLTWAQVRELRKAGVEFGSHTMTHPQLREVSPRQLREEIACSKAEIEQKLGETVGTFSYPYAFPEADRAFVGRLREVLQESGYRVGVSTILGRAMTSDNRLFMRRLPVNSHDDSRLFRAKLEGGYDWLHIMQYAAKVKKGQGT